MRQEDFKIKASLGYITRPHLERSGRKEGRKGGAQDPDPI
jgi:hypothetical protein